MTLINICRRQSKILSTLYVRDKICISTRLPCKQHIGWQRTNKEYCFIQSTSTALFATCPNDIINVLVHSASNRITPTCPFRSYMLIWEEYTLLYPIYSGLLQPEIVSSSSSSCPKFKTNIWINIYFFEHVYVLAMWPPCLHTVFHVRYMTSRSTNIVEYSMLVPLISITTYIHLF